MKWVRAKWILVPFFLSFLFFFTSMVKWLENRFDQFRKDHHMHKRTCKCIVCCHHHTICKTPLRRGERQTVEWLWDVNCEMMTTSCHSKFNKPVYFSKLNAASCKIRQTNGMRTFLRLFYIDDVATTFH